jgi:hypothetical protein
MGFLVTTLPISREDSDVAAMTKVGMAIDLKSKV